MGMRRATLGLLKSGLRDGSDALRSLSTSTALSQAAASGATNGSRDFMGWLKGGAARVTTPLSQPLPGVQPEQPAFRPLAPPPTEVTVLENGVRIISEASPVGLVDGWKEATVGARMLSQARGRCWSLASGGSGVRNLVCTDVRGTVDTLCKVVPTA